MIPAVLLVLIATVGGTVATYAYDEDDALVPRLAYGAATGLVVLSIAGFAIANLADLTIATPFAALIAALPVLLLARRDIRAGVLSDLHRLRDDVGGWWRGTPSAVGPVIYGLGVIVLLWLVFDRVIVELDGGLSTGFVNNLGDMPFHIGVTTSFAFGQNFPPQDPEFAGTGFVYPYLSDFVTAMFVGLGASLRDAFLLGNLVLGLSFVTTLTQFTRVLTDDRLAGYLAPVLTLFSGGLGWLVFVQDALQSEAGVLGSLGSMTRDYTIVPEGPFRWGNAITTLLVTQRSLLMGLPIALLVMILLWRLIHRERASGGVGATRLAVAGGLLTASLPLVHAHSYLVVLGTAFLLGVLFRQWRDGRWRAWTWYVLIAVGLALPQVWWSTHDSVASAGTFFGLELGWDHGQENPIWFWFINTGLFIPAALAGMFVALRDRPARRSLVLFSTAFLAWFLVPNALKLAPWVWDNIKVLFYWYVGFVPLVAYLLARMLRSTAPARLGAVALVIVLTLAGGLDVWRAASGQTVYGEFDRDAVALAAQIRAQTPARAVFLNAPIWNATVFLTGRPTVMGYDGHVWSRGLPYVDRAADIRRIYAGEPDATALLSRYGVDYILVTPIERGTLTVNDAFVGSFTKIAEAGEYAVYEVPRP